VLPEVKEVDLVPEDRISTFPESSVNAVAAPPRTIMAEVANCALSSTS